MYDIIILMIDIPLLPTIYYRYLIGYLFVRLLDSKVNRTLKKTEGIRDSYKINEWTNRTSQESSLRHS